MKRFTLRSILTALLMLVGTGAWANEVTLDFQGWDFDGGRSGWSNSYAKHTATFENVTVVFSSANKQSSTITDCPVTKGSPITISWENINVTNVKVVMRQWTTKSQTATLSATTDGTNYESVASASNFTVEGNMPTGATGAQITFNSANQVGIAYIVLTTAEEGGVTVEAPTLSLKSGSYPYAQTVAIKAGEGCTIAYTTDGTDPKESETAIKTDWRETSVKIEQTTTLRAIAIDEEGNKSHEVKATYAILAPYTSIAALKEGLTTTPEACFVALDGWMVNASTSRYAYIQDNKGGYAYIDHTDHGLRQGYKLSGVVLCQRKLNYNTLCLTDITSKTEGLTIEEGLPTTPVEVKLADLNLDNDICKLVTVKGVKVTAETYEQNNTKLTDGETEVLLYNTFGCLSITKFDTNATYDITGIIPAYSTLEIAPRLTNDIVSKDAKKTATTTWSAGKEETVEKGVTFTATITTDSDGEITYTSSNEAVATIDANGVITTVGYGETTIIATTAETDNYFASKASFTLKVIRSGSFETSVNYYDEDIKGKGAKNTGAEVKVTRDLLEVEFSNIYGNDTYIQSYGSSRITFTVPEGYVITNVKLDATNSYIRTWKDQYGTMATTTNDIATWTGFATSLTLTNQATAQARLESITVSYLKLDEVGEVSVNSDGYATYCPATGVIIGNGDVTKHITGVSEGNVLVLESTPVVAAGEGILLEGEGTYKVYSLDELANVEANTKNLLKGVAEDTTVPEGAYVLQNQNSKVGFYLVEGNDITCPAGKAYLQLPEAGAKVYLLGNETAISDIATEAAQPVIYNLAGQRVNKAEKGIYIVNGKKILK